LPLALSQVLVGAFCASAAVANNSAAELTKHKNDLYMPFSSLIMNGGFTAKVANLMRTELFRHCR